MQQPIGYFTTNHAVSMSLRDYFAAQIISGLVTGNETNVYQMARDAYKLADALIAERENDHS